MSRRPTRERCSRTLLDQALAALHVDSQSVTPLAGDASQRRFFRVHTTRGPSVVACLYPQGGEAQAERDAGVQRWGWERDLPIPRPLGQYGLVSVSEDVGDDDLERMVAVRGGSVLDAALETLAVFQRCPWDDCPTAPFDVVFFRNELAIFERFALPPPQSERAVTGAFLDALSERLVRHPYRLTHRDFHFNNLFWHKGSVRAVDYQDMRGGPDTYDLASLLRERAGADVAGSESRWRDQAAACLGWADGWERRYWECAAQRGLKVIGTFLRLAAAGRPAYLAWLPSVQARTREALAHVEAPHALVVTISGTLALRGV